MSPLPRGTYHRIKTFPSGKRIRLAILNGRVIETKVMTRAKRTKTQKSLKKARRRIGR